MPIRTKLADSTPDPSARPAEATPHRRAVTRWLLSAAAVAAACAVTAGLWPSGDGDNASRTVVSADGLPHTAVETSAASDGCGKGWRQPRAGLQVFDVHNGLTEASEVYLADSSGALLGELDGLAPGTTRPIRVTLGRGSYAFRCLVEDADAVSGPTVRITGGPAKGGPAVLPADQHDVIPPTLAYQKWVTGEFGGVVAKVDTLRDAVDRDDLPAARAAWLPAHLAFLRLGGAYGAFGDLGGAVDGSDAGLPGGVHDQDFTGFHRVEYGLWHGEPAKSLEGPADRLALDMRQLRTDWSQTRMDPLDTGLRAHEITEDSIQFDLTGRSDYGSGTSLASARAGLDGTAELLNVLRPLLQPRDPQLPELDSGLRGAERDLDATRSGGAWHAPGALRQDQRERVNADFGDLAEQLARVAVIFDIRRTS